jgi:hypothetical protein
LFGLEICLSPTKKAMEKIEEKIERLTESTNQDFPDLGQWFIDIYYDKT